MNGNQTTARAAILILFALATTPAVAANESSEALPTLIKRVQPAIVTVVGYDESGEISQLGTGFFVDRRGHVITNRHVLAGAAKAEVRGASGRTYAVTRVLAENVEADLIKLAVDIPITRVRILKMNRDVPEPGERVVVIGSPYGLEKTVSDGIVSTVREAADMGQMIQITAPISSGSSGSPVLNMQGRVLGVATVQLADGQNLNFAVPSVKAIELRGEPKVFVDWAADTHEKAALKAAAAGKFETSLELYQRALKIRSTSARAHDGAGMALHALGRYDEALAAYEAALAENPRYTTARYHLAELYERRNELDKAIFSYKEVLAIEPMNARAHHNAAVVLAKQGDRAGAMHHYEQLRALDATLAETLREKIEAAQKTALP